MKRKIFKSHLHVYTCTCKMLSATLSVSDAR